MFLILQKSVIDNIKSKIKTPTGKTTISKEIKYLYIIHRINHDKVFKNNIYHTGVSLSTEILVNLFGNGSEVQEVLNYLQRNSFIQKVKNHTYGFECSKYVLHASIANEKVYHIDFAEHDSALIRKLRNHSYERGCFTKQLSILENKIKLNDSGINYLEKKYGKIPQNLSNYEVEPIDISLIMIYCKNFFSIRPDNKSRVYTNLTSLPRVHRDFISLNNNPLLITDISNSQILLTVPLLHSYWAKNSGKGLINLPQDVKDFQILAESGLFYEELANFIGLSFSNAIDRNNFKKKVFEEIWFSSNSSRSTAIKKEFKKKFPNVFFIISELKKLKPNEVNKLTIKKPHRSFPIHLQRFEASIVIDKVWKSMIKTGKNVLTLHDAIICSESEDLNIAEELLRKELFKYRLNPKFKRE